MAGNLNRVELIGRLTQDPEKRITPSNKEVCNVSLATSEFYKDANGNKQEKTEFHRLVAWERNAQLLSDYTKKGSQLYIEGSLQTREWKDKDSNRRFTTEILVKNLQFLDSKKQQDNQSGYQQSGTPMHNAPPVQNDNFQNNQRQYSDDSLEDDLEIPF